MHTTILAAFSLTALLLPTSAWACSYPEPITFRAAISSATDVFVFRLDQAEYKLEELGEGAYTSWIEGRVKLAQNLYGNPTHFKRIKYSSSWCGGVDLVVGHHYLIATNKKGETIELGSADGSILDIEGFFNPRNKQRNLRLDLILPVVRAIYKVEQLPASYPPRHIAARTVIQPPRQPD